MKRKLLFLALAIGVLFAVSVPAWAGVTDPGFSDVSPDAWYAEGVAYCKEHGLMNGTSATTFAPEEPMTRAMLMTVLYRLAGEPAASTSNPFTDVAAGTWYTDAVLWAQQNHIVSGYGDGRFGTNDPILREQLAVILWRYADSPETETAEIFSDKAAVSAYAANAVDWAGTTGVITERTDGRFEPASPATRGEVAMAFMNLAHMNETIEPGDDTMPKILIAYFSFEGHTKQIAEEIHAQIGGDLFEITPETPYVGTRNDLSGIASTELRENARPALSTHVSNMEQYDMVFVGYPCWWSNAPMAVFTFLEEYDFSGKTVVPFTSYGTSGWGNSIASIQKSVGDHTTIAEGFSVQEDNMQNLSTRVAAWLQEIGVAQ